MTSFEEISHTLEGLKMTIVSGIFLALSLICLFLNIKLPIDLAWGSVIISGIPLLYLAISRLIYEKWVSSALLITVAMIASLMINQVFAAGEVAFIMAIGALLEDYTVDRAKNGLKKLIELTPQQGRLITIEGNEEKEEIVKIDNIPLGSRLRILPGEVIPIDGEILEGNTSINQSIMTGESLPVDKQKGDEVFCGTMNLYGSIDIKTTSIGENSSLQKLINMVKEAEEKQAPTQRIADKWATWLVPVALLIAILAFVFTWDIERAVTVLVVFCPCALILATPTSIMAAIGQATKYGVLIKSGEALEILGKTNTIAFDKTGTLTYGDLKISDVIPTEDYTEEDILKIAGAAEKRSEHPLAKALIEHINENEIKLEDIENFQMIPGKGIQAKLNNEMIYCGNLKFQEENNIQVTDTIKEKLKELTNQGKANIIIGTKGKTIGLIGLSDTLRENSELMLRNLENLDTKTILLTGDNNEAAQYLSEKIGIGEVYANLLPEDKVSVIERLKNNGEMVAMIGDGVNDAPALKTANVSIAMANVGSDIAIDSADVALLGDDISKIPYLKRLSNATLFNIHFNIALSMCINFVAIILSVLGYLNPVTGALVHNIGSCLVIANAGLLYDRKFDKDVITAGNNESNIIEHTHEHSHPGGDHEHTHDDFDEIIYGDGESITHTHKHIHHLGK